MSHDGSEGENSDRMLSAGSADEILPVRTQRFCTGRANETTDFRMSPPLVRSSNRECFCLETSESSPDTGYGSQREANCVLPWSEKTGPWRREHAQPRRVLRSRRCSRIWCCIMHSIYGCKGHSRVSASKDTQTMRSSIAELKARPEPSWRRSEGASRNVVWNSTRRKPGSSTARIPAGDQHQGSN
jgi:hypothetical protein